MGWEDVETPQVLIDKTGRFEKLDPEFQGSLMNLANQFYQVHQKPLVLTDTLRTQGEQAAAHAAKPTLALPANSPYAMHPQGMAVDFDQSQSPLIPDEWFAKFGLHRPALPGKGEHWHVEPVSTQGNRQGSSQGKWVDIDESIQPQANLQPPPNVIMPETAQEGIIFNEPAPAMVQSPQSLESRIGSYIPQGFKDVLSSGLATIAGTAGKLVPTIPQTGAMAGGISGAKLGAMSGNPLGALGGSLVGAGLGYAGMSQAENVGKVISGQQMPPISDQAQEVPIDFLKGVTQEAGGQSLVKIASPFANRIAQRIRDDAVIREAQSLVEKGASISPSEISGTKTARALEWLAEKVWPASSKMAKQRGNLQVFADGLKEEFATSRGLYDVSKSSVGKAWDNWVSLAGGPDSQYAMPQTAKALEDAMGKPFAQMGAFWKKHAATFNEQLKTGKASVQAIRDIFNTINPTASKGAERTARMKIADAIVSDLESVGGKEVSEALMTARELAYLNRVAGPLRAIINSSIIEPIKAGETVAFSPSKFVNLWNQRRPNFVDNKNYSDVDIAAIDKFANQMKALTNDLSKASKFVTPTSFSGATQLNLENPLAIAAGVIKQPLISLPVGADFFLARSLMSPNGWMRRWLTTGLKPELTARTAAGKGISMGVDND